MRCPKDRRYRRNGQKLHVLPFLRRGRYLKRRRVQTPHPNYVHVWIDNFIIDDVDRDGAPDAIVVLAQNGGGSGTFALTALLSTQNGILQTNSVSLGDRVKIDSVKVVENSEALSTSLFEPKKIVIDMLTHKESDPLCSLGKDGLKLCPL
ncbi:MAG: hypothetical protein ABC360_08115 [Acetomicrobium sp.]